MDTPSDFVTIAEAARRLGISERQAHRYASRLSDSDRRKTDRGQTLVSLPAMQRLRPQVEASDARQTDDRHLSDDGSGALIEQLRQENARLWQALERQQVLTLEAQRNANRAQERIGELETMNAKLITALPVADIGQTHDRPGERQTDGGQVSDIVTDPYGNTADSSGNSTPASPRIDRTGAGGGEGVSLHVPTSAESATERKPERAAASDPVSTMVDTAPSDAQARRPWWQVWKR